MKADAFAKIPVWLLSMKPPAHAVLVYAVLYLYSDWGTGTVTISHRDIADASGVSYAHVRRMLVWLEENGALSWECQSEGPVKLPNLYTIAVDKPPALTERTLQESEWHALTERYTSLQTDSYSEGERRLRPVDDRLDPWMTMDELKAATA